MKIFLTLLLLIPCLSWGLNVNLNKETTDLGGSSSKGSHNYQLIQNIVRAGEYSQRFELNHGECGGDTYWDDCTNDRQRVERNFFWDGIDKTYWLGFSLFIEDYSSELNISLIQMKVNGWRDSIWMLRQNETSVILEVLTQGKYFSCFVGSIKNFNKQWNDILIKSELSFAGEKKPIGQGGYLELYVNGEEVKDCRRRRPLFNEEVYENRPKNKKAFLINYGIYQSQVSKWLDKNKTKEVNVIAFEDVDEKTGRVIKSITNEPFKYDWGVEIPKRVIYFDEIRLGNSRKEVDINLINKPVD